MTKDNGKTHWDDVASEIYNKYGGAMNSAGEYSIHCPCEGHNDSTPSCTITPMADKVMSYCHVCDDGGNRASFMALREAGFRLGSSSSKVENDNYFEKVWLEAEDGDILTFNDYCDARGLTNVSAPDTDALRVHDGLYHSGTKRNHLGLVCKVVDTEDNHIGSHRTYLNKDGTGKLEIEGVNNKKMIGNTRGGHVELRAGAEILHVAEGLETTLALLQELPEVCSSDAIWATLSAGNLAAVQLPGNAFKTIHIWADHDHNSKGRESAERLATRLTEAGLTCIIHVPEHVELKGKSVDWLDQISEICSAVDSGTTFKLETETTSCKPVEWKIDEAIIPNGYEISAQGVWKLVPGKGGDDDFKRLKISPVPIWVRSRCPEINSQMTWLEIRYYNPTHRRYLSINVPGDAFISVRNFQNELLKQTRFAVELKMHGELCDYLNKCGDLAERSRPLSDTLGWIEVDGEPHFVPYSESVSLKNLSGKYADIRKSIRKKGTLEGWINEILEPVSRCYGASFILGAALAAPLLHLTETTPFSVCLTATRDGGKSVAVGAALNMWGCSKELAINAKSSNVGLQRGFEFWRDMPFLLEEVHQRPVKELADLLYNTGNETHILKGTKEGGLRDDAKGRCVLFLPGENNIVEELSNDGANVRVFVLESKPLAELTDNGEREAFADALKEHFGHVGPLLGKAIAESYKTGALKKMYRQMRKELPITYDFQPRQVPRYAAMLTGIEFLREIVGDLYADRIKSAVMKHWNDAAEGKLRTLVASRALAAVLDHKASHPTEFYYSEDRPARELTGELQDDGSLAIIKSRLKHIFRDDFNVSNVIEEWRNRDWLQFTPAEKERKATRTRARIGMNPREWSIVISKRALDEYYSSGDDELEVS